MCVSRNAPTCGRERLGGFKSHPKAASSRSSIATVSLPEGKMIELPIPSNKLEANSRERFRLLV